MVILSLLFLLLAAICAAANTEQYNAISKASKGKVLELGHKYAFTTSKGLHKRLVVGLVVGTPGYLDFYAHVFQLTVIATLISVIIRTQFGIAAVGNINTRVNLTMI